MSIVTTWSIPAVEYDVDDGYIHTVHWNVVGVETVGDTTYTASRYGSVSLARTESPVAFGSTPTKAQVLTWSYDRFDRDAGIATGLLTQKIAIETGIRTDIQVQQNPVIAIGILTT